MTLLNSQIGQEIFLANDYLSLGLNGSGTLGTKATAPVGHAADVVSGYVRVGLVADTDGFGTGAAQTRDVMLGGTPVETFALGYKFNGTKVVNVNSERDGKKDIAGTAKNLSDHDTNAAGWTGTSSQGMKVEQVMTMTDDAKYIRVDVKITNTTSVAATDLRYFRSIDPDHGSTFNTNNVIVEQGGDGADGALVAAYASKTSTPFFFFSQDDRAVVSTYGFENFDPYAAAAYDTKQAEGYAVSADQSVNINFGLGTLGAGQSTTVTYYMGVTDNLTTTLAAIKAAAGEATPPAPAPEPVNHAPLATDDALSVGAGLKGTGNVLTNDTDADGNSLSAALKTGPANGTLTLNANGTYEYTPKAGFSGSDTFSYTVSDGKLTSTGVVTITVTPPPNAAPVAKADALNVVAGKTGEGNVLANDTDANGDLLTATVKTGPANGTLTLKADGSYVYTPKVGFSGSDTFTYTVTDGKASATGQVTVTVAPPPNTGPVANADTLAVTGGSTGTVNVLTNDSDADGDSLTATLKTGPANGTLTAGANGAFTYTPKAGFSGTDSFTYTLSDGKATSVGTVTLNVSPKPNNGPSAQADSADAEHNTAATGNVLANDTDADGDALHASVVTGPLHGVLSLSDDGLFTYTPNAGFSGVDSFTYAATDGKASSNATVTINVAEAPVVETPPVEAPVEEKPPVIIEEPEAPAPAPTPAVKHDISATTNDVVSGGAGRDHFYVDVDATSGADRIQNFGAEDLLVTSKKLYDSNNDGSIGIQSNKLSIDAPKSKDTVVIEGVSTLRLLGNDADGNFVYANAATMPKGAKLSTTADQTLAADAKDKKAQTFFFDTATGLDFGTDKITLFGNKDTIATTSALKLNADGKVDLAGGRLLLDGSSDAFGTVDITNLKGAALSQLDFEGTVEHGGMTYYVYAMEGSTAFHTVSF